jgi:hypothetical protein
MIFIGYEFASRMMPTLSVAKSAALQYAEDCPPLAIVGTLILGWTATIYLFRRGQFGYLASGQEPSSGFTHLITQYASGLVPLSLAALAAVIWSDWVFPSMSRRLARALLLVNIPPLLVVSLASGVKGQLVTLLLPVGIVYVLLRGRVPWKAVVVIGVYLVITFGGLQQYRSDISAGSLSSSQTHGLLGPAGRALSNVVTDWVKASPTSHVRTFWDSVTAEYSSVPQTIGIIVTQTPSPTPYLGAKRYLSGPFFFLPASIFQGPVPMGTYVAVNYRGGLAGTTSAPATQPGDFYMAGGLPLVIGGEFVVGILIGALWLWLSPTSTRVRSTVLYSIIAVDFASGGLDFAGLVRHSLGVVVVYGVFSRFIFPRRTLPSTQGKVRLPRRSPSSTSALGL